MRAMVGCHTLEVALATPTLAVVRDTLSVFLNNCNTHCVPYVPALFLNRNTLAAFRER